jgi:site-specific recombinase XerD
MMSEEKRTRAIRGGERTAGEAEINAFLSHLALKKKVSASTQNQALSAILFLYRSVLKREIKGLGDVIRARRPKRLATVMTRDEVADVLSHLEGEVWLMCSLMYGAGLRLTECLRLRVQDVDFGANQIVIRDGKGSKDRLTLPGIHLRHICLKTVMTSGLSRSCSDTRMYGRRWSTRTY